MSEYKYIIFFLALLIGVPVAVVLAYSSKFWEKIIVFMMMFFTASLAGTINFYSHKDYRGTSRGFEVGIVDLATLVVFFLIIIKPKFKIKWFPPGSLLFFIYYLFSVISLRNSANLLYSEFEVWSMTKMYFYFWVWYNYFIDLEHIQQVIGMLPVIVIYTFLAVVYQKRMGVYQPGGPFPHQNSLSMYFMTLGGIFLALLLEIKTKQITTLWLLGLFGICSFIECLALSRAGIVCYAGCCTVVLFFSFLSRFRTRKILVFILISLVGLAGLLFYADAIYERFAYAPKSSMECRENLAVSAKNMANDKFFGIGLNNFGVKVNAEYPYSKHYLPKGFKEGLVESVYLMIAAETGWLNMFVFIFMLAYFYIINVRNIFRYRDQKILYLPIAIAGGLSALYVQSYLEWVLKQPCNFYQMMFFFAIIISMARIYQQNRKRPAALVEN
ncbi:MAG: O-antigen ligase family protein [Victivallaceae bacterium]|nr:O-antigen ligase family protein [Victivallaceae bacterium]